MSTSIKQGSKNRVKYYKDYSLGKYDIGDWLCKNYTGELKNSKANVFLFKESI